MFAETTFHSRHEHGAHPVRVLPQGKQVQYEVDWPAGPRVYSSARSLIRALYNRGDGSTAVRDPGVSFRRYFGLATTQTPPQPGILDLLGVPTPVVPTTHPIRSSRSPRPCRTPLRPVLPLLWESLIVEAPRPPLLDESLVVAPVVGPELGIDLAARAYEVRKLLFAGFGGRIARYGYEGEDVLQEVYRGLLARNVGICPFDVRKSSFGHYVHIVISCVLSNYHRKLRRRAQFEQVGFTALNRGRGAQTLWIQVDAAEAAVGFSGHENIESGVSTELAVNSLAEVVTMTDRPETELAIVVLPLMAEGYQRSEIAVRLGEDPVRVSRALALIRATAREWAIEEGLR